MNNKAKYFTGMDYDFVIDAASEYFGCEREKLSVRTITEGSEVVSWLILAKIRMPDDDFRSVNGRFELCYEEDGVYFELYPPSGDGTTQDMDEVSAHIQRKQLKSYSPLEVLTLFKKGAGRVRIAAPQEELLLEEDIAVTFSPDELEARMRLLPPEEGGSSLTPESIREKVRDAGVLYGLIEDVLDEALREKNYKNTYIIAKGLAPLPPTDASIKFHFRTQLNKGPRARERDRVDHKTLDLFESVEAGQLLVTRTPVIPGTPGRSVKDREIQPNLGKDVNMPKSKNATVNEDMTEMRSDRSGMVEFSGGRVTVSDLYTVKGDCDLSVGNIDFDGNVRITGGVISGLVIKASGHILIEGVVEGSEIVAGGNVDLKRGMQGIDRGKIIAGGSITAQFIERATVVSGQDITSDVIVHCKIDAGRSLILNGKRSNLVGGEIRVSEQVLAKVIGSVSHAQVDIEVGLHPKKRARIKFLREKIAKIGEELKKLNQLKMYIDRQNTQVQGNKEEMLNALVEKVRPLTQDYQEETQELAMLEQELEQAVYGRVHILDTAYPGVKVTIGTGFYKVEDEIKYATFKYKDGKVIFTTCEVGGRK